MGSSSHCAITRCLRPVTVSITGSSFEVSTRPAVRSSSPDIGMTLLLGDISDEERMWQAEIGYKAEFVGVQL